MIDSRIYNSFGTNWSTRKRFYSCPDMAELHFLDGELIAELVEVA